uniref:Uncharacterized protein n=1 Tax=Chlorella vulgaris TaxID=3077 RepID=V9H0R7_CHLVU|nr:hypothetical protein ChvulCp024 [Chlorella vulgaris]pir/T07212/ hypothetical protein 57a - Chlorella vulgaris chloroplast [Chlorella vulgaris]BAA57859.1 unnamed protein product [Chlorella vulgaris]
MQSRYLFKETCTFFTTLYKIKEKFLKKFPFPINFFGHGKEKCYFNDSICPTRIQVAL